jgi:hypothetical protein
MYPPGFIAGWFQCLCRLLIGLQKLFHFGRNVRLYPVQLSVGAGVQPTADLTPIPRGQLLGGQMRGGISGRRDGGLLWHAAVLWHNNSAKRTLLVRCSFQRCQLRCDNAARIRSAKILNRGNAGLADVKFHESRHRTK